MLIMELFPEPDSPKKMILFGGIDVVSYSKQSREQRFQEENAQPTFAMDILDNEV
jgi:hypothetical protein